MPTPSGATQDEIRRRNVSTLLRHVHVEGQLSRAAADRPDGPEPQHHQGAGRGSVLCRSGRRDDPGNRSSGRPAVAPRRAAVRHGLRARREHGRRHGHGRGDRAGRGLSSRAANTGCPGPASGHEPSSSGWPRSSTNCRRLCSEPRGLPASGSACPARFVPRRRRSRVRAEPRLARRPVRRLLSDGSASRCQTALGNDGDLGGLAEHVSGAGRGIDNMIYLAGEVGIGGGIVVDGRIVSGAQGFAGELGHMMVNSQGRACRCGSRGCFETEAARTPCSSPAVGRPDQAGRAHRGVRRSTRRREPVNSRA